MSTATCAPDHGALLSDAEEAAVAPTTADAATAGALVRVRRGAAVVVALLLVGVVACVAAMALGRRAVGASPLAGGGVELYGGSGGYYNGQVRSDPRRYDDHRIDDDYYNDGPFKSEQPAENYNGDEYDFFRGRCGGHYAWSGVDGDYHAYRCGPNMMWVFFAIIALLCLIALGVYLKLSS